MEIAAPCGVSQQSLRYNALVEIEVERIQAQKHSNSRPNHYLITWLWGDLGLSQLRHETWSWGLWPFFRLKNCIEIEMKLEKVNICSAKLEDKSNNRSKAYRVMALIIPFHAIYLQHNLKSFKASSIFLIIFLIICSISLQPHRQLEVQLGVEEILASRWSIVWRSAAKLRVVVAHHGPPKPIFFLNNGSSVVGFHS